MDIRGGGGNDGKKNQNGAFYSAEALFSEPVFPDPAKPRQQQPGGDGRRWEHP